MRETAQVHRFCLWLTIEKAVIMLYITEAAFTPMQIWLRYDLCLSQAEFWWVQMSLRSHKVRTSKLFFRFTKGKKYITYSKSCANVCFVFFKDIQQHRWQMQTGWQQLPKTEKHDQCTTVFSWLFINISVLRPPQQPGILGWICKLYHIIHNFLK